jgi:zinc transport system substrate-binding protein
LVLNPIGGLTKEEMEASEDYFSIMAKNLAALKKALE